MSQAAQQRALVLSRRVARLEWEREGAAKSVARLEWELGLARKGLRKLLRDTIFADPDAAEASSK